jgi:two-component system nitrogen regulation sensor histidine kinase NtrY
LSLSLPAGLRALARRVELERRLPLVLTVSAIVAGIATYALTSWAPPSGTGVRTVLVLLNVDLILLLLLGIVVTRRLVRLVVERRQGSAGSRLHVRLAVLFAALAATPAIVVAIFSVVFLSSGLEHWFSSRVSSALENSLAVAEAYLDEHREVIRADALAMAADLEREGAELFASPSYLRHVVVGQAALRSLTEVILFDAEANVLAHSGLGIAQELGRLPADVTARAGRGEVVTLTSAADDRVRAVLRLTAAPDVFLFVGRFIDPQVLRFVERTQSVVAEYRALQSQRSGIQITSALIFAIVALLLLMAAVMVGLNLADRLATPVSRLIGAAERVRAGDLTARVPDEGGDDEIDLLARAFNRMTDQLDAQRRELVATNEELEERRRFTEAVLAGVSAGVIGLDAARRIVLPNRLAGLILKPRGGELAERPVDAVFPELAPLFERLDQAPDATVQGQLTVERRDSRRILLVRLAAQREDGRTLGYVVTFDDVTDLVAAQRQVAWAEVARRIAHEIKNPLTPIRLSAERLGRRFLPQIAPEDRESFARSVSTVIAQVDTIGRLVSEFSAFARLPRPTLRFEPLGEIVAAAVALQQGAWPKIAFATQLPAEDALIVPCDAEQVGQALTNLLHNAVNALSEHGTARPRVTVTARRVEGGIAVEVEDNGPGFATAEIERLFEPYVTTRAKGTGLGLAIVKKIMEEHQGRVELANAPAGGALARLWFPVGGAEGAPPPAGPSTGRPREEVLSERSVTRA